MENEQKRLLSPAEVAERSIIKKYRKTIWNRFINAIKDYRLISPNDKIGVCISGGKDSMLMAKCIQHLQKYSEIPFTAEYIVMNPGYNEQNLQKIVDNAKTLGLPIKIFNSPIFDVVASAGGSPCYLCARMRRGYLYRQAQELGCNKIALGHHFNDVIETTLLSMLYGAEVKTMMPKLKSTNFEGMQLIRPLYMVREDDIIAWAHYNNLEFIRCACRFTENCANAEDQIGESKRLEIKAMIKQMKKTNPEVDVHIFRSMHAVNLASVVGYKEHDGGEVKSVMDDL